MSRKAGRERAAVSPGVVRDARSVASRPVEAGIATEVRVLLDEADGAPNFAMRLFTMGEGGGMPRHTNRVEHEQYVVSGRGRVTIGDEVHEVARGDVLYIPAGTPHSYEVVVAPFEFLCVVPNAEDAIEIVGEPR